LRAGANGYIMKHEAAEKVLVAIRQILNHNHDFTDNCLRRFDAVEANCQADTGE
jgi:DNA-binding NarL/FixJ family response regulator